MSEKSTEKSGNRNALVHGVYATDVLMPWDSKEDFERLHNDLKAEFSPRGRAEEEAVLDLALLHWQKQTVWRMRPTAVLSDPFLHDIMQTERKSWPSIRKRLRKAAKDHRTLKGVAEANNAELLSQVQGLQKKLAKASGAEEVKLLEGKLDALHRTMSEHAVPLLQALAQAPNAEQAFDDANGPESLERILRLEAIVDARIAKVLARLVGLKEFKRTPAAAGAPVTSKTDYLTNG
jgi:hypothetical protein